ncbi:GNAT family N-acetyltransferase [Phyllobacterium bourgognense]|uniref:RimJ/RimL family protein N-acetyltransferase n=1 Tax=Phyllobacterium bourgognense TaxID=314236 RepID=A0A368YQR3_9HYPH|nr:GNAT family N-acetyltransferase [Phyllobacterium bourgognense]RCW81908.1 RimJ/RimL family protein N-acetyltransferase [Phyllobacterium bourgognense]
MQSTLVLKSWTTEGFEILRQNNTPDQTLYIGGPESEEKLADRQRRYMQNSPGITSMQMIEFGGVLVGSIGYWETVWNNMEVYETGWAIVPEFRGRGIARGALVALVEHLRPIARHSKLQAYPSIDNIASNALCRRCGFKFLGEYKVEYPPGRFFRGNAWELELI